MANMGLCILYSPWTNYYFIKIWLIVYFFAFYRSRINDSISYSYSYSFIPSISFLLLGLSADPLVYILLHKALRRIAISILREMCCKAPTASQDVSRSSETNRLSRTFSQDSTQRSFDGKHTFCYLYFFSRTSVPFVPLL